MGLRDMPIVVERPRVNRWAVMAGTAWMLFGLSVGLWLAGR